MEKIPLIYIRVDDLPLVDPVLVTPHDIDPLSKEKRLRVFKGQLMDTVIEQTNCKNYLFQASLYFKYGYRLLNKFPEYQEEIENATMLFWSKVQSKLKLLKSSAHK